MYYNLKYMRFSRAFSIIEMIVVLAIVAALAGVLVVNFRASSRNASARHQVANKILSDIRAMQSRALAGSTVESGIVCGFGAHYVNEKTYLLFARPILSGLWCEDDSRSKTYYSGDDEIIDTVMLGNANMIFLSSFSDIYFEIPYSTTYIDGATSSVIEIAPVGESESSSITSITVYNSGRIDINN